MIFECLECGTVFESASPYAECPNEQTGLETHAVREITNEARPGMRRRRFRLFGKR